MKTFIIILLILVSGLIGCSKESLNQNLISTEWYLYEVQYTDTQIEEFVPTDLKGMNIVFSDSNRLHAISSCNVFDGDFDLVGSDSIRVENLITTLIYCTDSNKRLWESKFYDNLKNSSKYNLKNGTLSIQTSIKTVMVFKITNN